MAGYTVYMHVSPNGKRYIGITSKKPEYRWNHGDGYKTNKHFYSAISKYGWNNFTHTIVAVGLSKKEACAMEQRLISKYNTTNPENGYNNSIGGESGSLGVKRTAEQIARMVSSRDYSNSWNIGKHLSPDHKRKISDAEKGKKVSDETRKKLSESHKGKPNIKLRGRKFTKSHIEKLSTKIVCVETGKTYTGLMEAERELGISHANISNCLRGKRDSAGGLHWEYA